MSYEFCRPIIILLLTDKVITKNAFKLLFRKNSLGGDMHSHERLLVIIIIIDVLLIVAFVHVLRG